MPNDPLANVLPPETDYITFLTFLEFNLTRERLPEIHNILQDADLTSNIGWDLVHLLLPLLPESQQCLQDVARLGNPREVILKVGESLEALGLEADGEDEDEEEDRGEEDGLERKDGIPTNADGDDGGENGAQNMKVDLSGSRNQILRFTVLLDMLAILHPRIRTKRPSRFLATTLQAILPAYRHHSQESQATFAVLKFIRSMSGAYRPALPPRQSTNNPPLSPAPDPEDDNEAIPVEEKELQGRLLQSFLTHILEECIESLPQLNDVPAMAWTSRFMEAKDAKAVIREIEFTSRFDIGGDLYSRSVLCQQFDKLARQLKLDIYDLHSVIMAGDHEQPELKDELPSRASDVPLSYNGSIYLYALQTSIQATLPPPDSTPFFPFHHTLITNILNPNGTFDSNPIHPTLVDAILLLGFHTLTILPNLSAWQPPPNDFKAYLQTLSLISATCPSPTLRTQTNHLVSQVLHSHPSDSIRLDFIKTTLEQDTYVNLKEVAVGWFKHEILTASVLSENGSKHETLTTASIRSENEPSLFATSTAFDILAPLLFIDLRPLLERQDSDNGNSSISSRDDKGFLLAVLNLYYLILKNGDLSSSLDVSGVSKRENIVGRFINPFRLLVQRHLDNEADSGEVALDLFGYTLDRLPLE